MMNITNLQRLSAFLKELDEDRFYVGEWQNKGELCGTVCCSIGWTPTIFPELGINIRNNDSWCDLSKDVYDIVYNTPDWNWCFDYKWKFSDGTAASASRRIDYIIEHGSPPSEESWQRVNYYLKHYIDV